MERILNIEEIREAASDLARERGLERVYLFGSYARGDATPESDVDLRIDEGALGGLFALSGLYLALQERLHKKVDLLTTDSLDDAFLSRIQSEEVLLYADYTPQGDENGGLQYRAFGRATQLTPRKGTKTA